MRTIYILSTVCIVLLASACAGLRDGSPSCVSCATDVASEPPQTTSPAEQTPSPAEPTAGAKPIARFDNLPECEGGPNRVWGPPPGPPNGQPACRAKPTAIVQAAKIIGLTIFPEVSEIKVGDTVDFQMRIQLSPAEGLPPKIIPPPPGQTYTLWETDNPAVAAVATSTRGGEPRGGSLTALAPGEVTLSARFFQQSATRMLRIIP
jgi:hypothetical protein